MLKQLLLLSIRFYQKVLSPDTGVVSYIVNVKTCRFTPRCSEYTYEAIRRYGIIRGVGLGVARIVRCRPGVKSGYDPVPTLII